MSWYANKVCMHDMKRMRWRVVQKRVCPIKIYYQSMHKQNLKKHLNLTWFFHFFNFHFWVDSYYPDHLLFKQAFFVKKTFFYYFQHHLFIPDVIFFTTFRLTLKKYFFSKKTNTTFIFSIFYFFIQNKLSSYFEKEKERKPLFLYFFRNWKHNFCFDK